MNKPLPRLCENADTTGFSRVVLQLQPKGAVGLAIFFDTTDFSRVEFSVSAFFDGAGWVETEPSTRRKVGGI